MSDVPFQPEHHNTINIYLFVDDARAAIDFYQRAFNGVLGDLMEGPGGSVMHASIRIGESSIMLSEANEQWGTKSPATLGGSPASIHLYVEDVDAAFQRAIEAGATEIAPVMDCFWGERMGKLQDPFGFQWGISTQTEILSPEEISRRGEAWMKQMSEGQPDS